MVCATIEKEGDNVRLMVRTKLLVKTCRRLLSKERRVMRKTRKLKMPSPPPDEEQPPPP